jgi:Arc/MetJ-type ribon-helix-helix transcriptional regulator
LANRPYRAIVKLQEHNEVTIHLPNDLESSIQAAVRSGRFVSVDEAMAEAARLLLRQLNGDRSTNDQPKINDSPDPILGCMREDAGLMDEIVADAYRRRSEEQWRELDF